MKIVIQPEISISLDSIKVLAVRDLFEERRIIARVEGLSKGVVLWQGNEYNSLEARNWNNDTATERAQWALNQSPVIFE